MVDPINKQQGTNGIQPTEKRVVKHVGRKTNEITQRQQKEHENVKQYKNGYKKL